MMKVVARIISVHVLSRFGWLPSILPSIYHRYFHQCFHRSFIRRPINFVSSTSLSSVEVLALIFVTIIETLIPVKYRGAQGPVLKVVLDAQAEN